MLKWLPHEGNPLEATYFTGKLRMAKILIKLSTQDLHRKRQFKQKEKQSSLFGRARCILAHLDRKSKGYDSYPCNCTECRFVTTVCRAQIGKTQ